jgi:hypothetical protein
MGSSFLDESPHCSGVLPAQINKPSFPILIPSILNGGFADADGPRIELVKLIGGQALDKKVVLHNRILP